MSARTRETAVVILAAGQGTRMKSDLAKVLHPPCRRPLLHNCLAPAAATAPSLLVVIAVRDAELQQLVLALAAKSAGQCEPL